MTICYHSPNTNSGVRPSHLLAKLDMCGGVRMWLHACYDQACNHYIMDMYIYRKGRNRDLLQFYLSKRNTRLEQGKNNSKSVWKKAENNVSKNCNNIGVKDIFTLFKSDNLFSLKENILKRSRVFGWQEIYMFMM